MTVGGEEEVEVDEKGGGETQWQEEREWESE